MSSRPHYDDDRTESRSRRTDDRDDRSRTHHHSSSKRRSTSPRDDDRRGSSSRDNHGRSRRDDDDGRESKRSRKDGEKERGREKDSDASFKKPAKVRETSTERAARKAERKVQKAADAALLLPQDARQAAAEVSFYSSTDNPFHDHDLGSKFIWGKKREKERKSGMSTEEARKRDVERQIESQQEIERLNARRAEREVDMQLREEESMRAARMAESAQMSAWIDREDDFHLEQAKKRAEIRVRERRAKPIDFLALNLKWSQPPLQEGDEGFDEEEEDEGIGFEVDMEEPYTIFDNLTLEDSEELHEDIKMYLSLEKLESNLEFWRSLLIVSSSSLENLRDQRSLGTAGGAQSRANATVKAEITRLLAGKSLDQLVDLQGQVQRKLSSGEPVDVEYWEGLLKELVVWKAKGKLGDMHEIVLNNRLEQLRQKQRDEAIKYQAEVKYALHAPALPAAARSGEGSVEAFTKEETKADKDMDIEEEAVVEQWDTALELVSSTKVPEQYRGCSIVDAGEELVELYAARRAVVQTRFVAKPRKAVESAEALPRRDAKADEIYQAAVGQGLDEEEELFNLEVQMSKQAYTWEDKYRPRKPRYFNKVHTGYEWNKYNQTHYDTDNPPPKVVQGYKFNIFYPDLIDKSKAPSFQVIKTKGNDDTCVLLFKAGPPYEDLAFTIVNKEWEYSHKRGFRSSFDRGVLQVYVNFKRAFYRK